MIEFIIYEEIATRIRSWIYYRNHRLLRLAVHAARRVC